MHLLYKDPLCWFDVGNMNEANKRINVAFLTFESSRTCSTGSTPPLSECKEPQHIQSKIATLKQVTGMGKLKLTSALVPLPSLF
jgi:hypothetical protein